MKRLVAEFLRYRTPWQLWFITIVFGSAATAYVMTVRTSTLKRTGYVVVLLGGIAGAAFIISLVRYAELGAENENTSWARFLGAYLGAGLTVAFVAYSLGVYGKQMRSACSFALLPKELAARKAALQGAQAKLSSPFALLPRLVSNEAQKRCAGAAKDLARLDEGRCPYFAITDHPCTCGGRTVAEASCKEPYCLYAPDKPDVFRCPGEDHPEGYSHSPYFK